MNENIGIKSLLCVLVKEPRDIEKLIKDNHICRGQLFYDELTNDLYVVDQGDLDLYWMRVGREEYIKPIKEEENPFLK